LKSTEIAGAADPAAWGMAIRRRGEAVFDGHPFASTRVVDHEIEPMADKYER
jgi:hypothetical protein